MSMLKETRRSTPPKSSPDGSPARSTARAWPSCCRSATRPSCSTRWPNFRRRPARRSPTPPGSTNAMCGSGSAAWSAGASSNTTRPRRRIRLPRHRAAVLTRAAGPDNLARVAQFISLLGEVEQKIIGCFRAWRWAALQRVSALPHADGRDERRGLRRRAVDVILPMADGLPERLRAGADVADIGTGSGHAINVMAKAFPASRFTGIDFSDEGLGVGRAEAHGSGLTNATFMAKDVAAVRRSRNLRRHHGFRRDPRPGPPGEGAGEHLPGTAAGRRPADGRHQSVDQLEDNVGVPLTTYFYTVSTMHCMSVSLGLDGDGLGTCWGRQLATSMLADAGFADVTGPRDRVRPVQQLLHRAEVDDAPPHRLQCVAALDAIEDWPVPTVAAAVVGPSGILAQHGDVRHRFELASVTKPLVARAAQVAVEEGVVELDTEAGPPGSTVRHLLAHASGYSMHSADLMAEPGKAPGVLELRIRGPRRDDPAGVGHRVRAIPDRGGVRAARHVGHRAGRAGPRRQASARHQPSPTWSRSPATCCGRRRSPSRCTPRPPTCSFRACPGCCPGSGRSGPTTGAWASRSGTASRRTGRARPTRAAPTGILASQGRFCGLIPQR